jgi:hypothetical protein
MPTSNDPAAPADAACPPAGAVGEAPNDGVYAVQLRRPDTHSPRAIAGRLEHVMSGRRHDFDTGAALLRCLRHEQAQVLAARRAKR